MKKGVFIGSLIVFLIALLWFVYTTNLEFIFYAVILLIALYVVYKLDKIYDFPSLGIVLFSLWGLSHMLGGSVYLFGTRLYDVMLIRLIGEPFFILRYDQAVHMLCYVAFGILVYFIVKKHTKKMTFVPVLAVILAAVGIGAVNEMIEFVAAVFLASEKGVGGYYNNMLDLFFNFIGAIIGVLYSYSVKH